MVGGWKGLGIEIKHQDLRRSPRACVRRRRGGRGESGLEDREGAQDVRHVPRVPGQQASWRHRHYRPVLHSTEEERGEEREPGGAGGGRAVWKKQQQNSILQKFNYIKINKGGN